MHDQPRIVTRSAQPYHAVARAVTDSVARAAEAAFGELAGWMRAQGISATGPRFVRVREVDHAGIPFAIEAGLPVAAHAVDASPAVIAGQLPAGRWATLLHSGPYCGRRGPGLDAARLALVRWAARQGLAYSHPTPRGEALVCCVDHLRVGPGVEPDDMRWQTELAYKIVETAGVCPAR